MSTSTDRLSLTKPAGAENVNVAILNTNFDRIDKNYGPYCKIRRSAGTQSVAGDGISVKVQFDSTSYDSYASHAAGAMADLVNERIICRKTGVYNCQACVTMTSDNDTYYALDILVNGTVQQTRRTRNPIGTPFPHMTAEYSHPLSLVSGDFVEAWFLQTAGNPLSIQSAGMGVDSTFLSLSWLGSLTL